MYRNLKFSWAHILAFLALIFIGYVSFVGLTYDIDDGFTKPALIMVGLLAIMILWFIGAQQLKGIDNDFDFKKCIWWERILLFSSPAVFILCMIPFNHAMNVSSNGEIIEERFKNAIDSSRKLFADYEVYAAQRITNYEDYLNEIKSDHDLQPSIYKEIGFTGTDDDKRIAIEIAALSRQLNENYKGLNTLATEWIDRVNQKTSVWNIFLVGNIKEIEKTIKVWNKCLQDFSKVILSTENSGDTEIKPFDSDKRHLDTIISELDSLSNIYNPTDAHEKLNPRTIIWGIFLYLLLLFPYIIQERNGVSTYTIFGRRFMHQGINMAGASDNNCQTKQKINPITINILEDDVSEGNNDSLQKQYIKETDEFLSKEERRKRRQERRATRNKQEKESEL